ncbi:MAG: cell wall hydrolase, partial [Lachnospiraceae bacterium]|nr:cell wall hydrolase [Lachnospiraceae bacterium]
GVVPKDYVAFVVEDDEIYTKVTSCDITGYVYQEFIGHDEAIIAIYEEEQAAARAAAEEAARLAAEAEAEYQRQLEILAHSQEIAELAAIIYLESGNQEYVGQVAVGAVVMNRVKSPYFPNTIHDVIFAPGQFSPAYKLYDAIASGKVKQSCMQAALEAWFGVDPTGGCHYFRRVNGTPGPVIGAHVFH